MDKPVFLAQRRRRNIKSQKDGEEKEQKTTPKFANACHKKHAKPREKVNVQSRSKKQDQIGCHDKGRGRVEGRLAPHRGLHTQSTLRAPDTAVVAPAETDTGR
jgi:hypothetical protein